MSGYCTLNIGTVSTEPRKVPGIFSKTMLAYNSGKPILDTALLVTSDHGEHVITLIGMFKLDNDNIALVYASPETKYAIGISSDDLVRLIG